jgi:hypothetical protein
MSMKLRLGMIAVIAVFLGSTLFSNGIFTIGGIPASAMGTFIQDTPAIKAFLTRDKVGLHNRLHELGVEEIVKNYYRPKISDEFQLDQYIHQIFYNWTGYVGNNYRVNPQGKLVLTKLGEKVLKYELWNKRI